MAKQSIINIRLQFSNSTYSSWRKLTSFMRLYRTDVYLL